MDALYEALFDGVDELLEEDEALWAQGCEFGLGFGESVGREEDLWVVKGVQDSGRQGLVDAGGQGVLEGGLIGRVDDGAHGGEADGACDRAEEGECSGRLTDFGGQGVLDDE